MARCDIFYLKKPLPKNWKKYFSARFSWSLPAVERLAQHTHGEIIVRINRSNLIVRIDRSNCLARDSSDKRGQDRIGLTRLRCFVAKKEEKNIETRISNLKPFSAQPMHKLNQAIQGWILNSISVNIYSSENKEGYFFLNFLK